MTKITYPITLCQCDNAFTINIPDFNIGTQGYSLNESVAMAADAIMLMIEDYNADGKMIPAPTSIYDIEPGKGEIVTLVYVNSEK